MSAGRGVTHPDGFGWQRGLISNAGAWTLVDPNGHQVAHVYRGNDHTWSATLAGGGLLGEGFGTSGAALAAVDNEVRPCAHADVEARRVLVQCDRDREPGSTFCREHGGQVAAA